MKRLTVPRALEILAVLFNLLYTLLYLRDNAWCFLFGILGPAFLFVVCTQKKIYADAGLQLVYIVLALYGWWGSADGWQTQHFSIYTHLLLLLCAGLVAMAIGFILKKNTDAQLPYLDSTIATFSVVATALMMLFVPENWLYFIAINSLSIVLYFRRKLYWASFMFLVYLFLAIEGYFNFGLL